MTIVLNWNPTYVAVCYGCGVMADARHIDDSWWYLPPGWRSYKEWETTPSGERLYASSHTYLCGPCYAITDALGYTGTNDSWVSVKEVMGPVYAWARKNRERRNTNG